MGSCPHPDVKMGDAEAVQALQGIRNLHGNGEQLLVAQIMPLPLEAPATRSALRLAVLIALTRHLQAPNAV